MQHNEESLLEFIKTTNLDKSLLVGYYGGGNFGDELLLEVLLNLLREYQPEARANIYYLHPEWFEDFHKDFGHQVVGATSLVESIKGFIRSKQIVVGGGGLWGQDFNPKVMFLSLMLFGGRFLLGKKVYLLGVGYYNSTTKLGRIGAWLAGKAASRIFARDKETYENFSKISRNVSPSVDFSVFLRRLDPNQYRQETGMAAEIFRLKQKTIYICVRKFKPEYLVNLENTVEETVKNNPDKSIVLGILEPKEINPEGYAFIESLAQKYANARAVDFHFNPVGFYFFTQKEQANLRIIAPHYHAIAIALYNHISHLPIVYDNKTLQLLRVFNVDDYLELADVNASHFQGFIDTEF